jgi:Periplasmic binding protein
MIHSSFHLPAAVCVALAMSAAPATAQTAGGTANLSGGKVKVGVLTDIAGPTALANGKGSVIAAEMAAEDFGAGLNVEVISADHSGKPDTGSQIAARWFDVEGVDAIADMQGSPIGFAVQNLATQKGKIMLLSGSTSSDFNGKACSPLTVQWTVDTYNLAKGAAKAVIEAGGTRWYLLTVDQAYGHALWAERFYAKAKIMPTSFHAGVYSSVAHYLKAVKATGTDDAPIVMKQMENERVHDFFASDGYIRADRKMIHDMYLLQVKKPGENKGDWDLYNVVQTLPGESVNRPISESQCPLVKK